MSLIELYLINVYKFHIFFEFKGKKSYFTQYFIMLVEKVHIFISLIDNCRKLFLTVRKFMQIQYFNPK